MTVPRVLRNRRVLVALQLLALAVLLASLLYAVRGVWPEAAPRLRAADPVALGLSLVALAAYYLVFVLGWMWILASFGIRIQYRAALQSEMVSMLAKYVPGGVWTPAARVVALRRFGTYDTRLVLASIALEAGLSAVAGVIVFLLALPLAGVVDAPLLPLVAFGLVVTALLHPRVFPRVAGFLFRPFGATEVPPLPYSRLLSILAFYLCTWPLGGLALFFLLRSVGGDPALTSIAFLGGAAAVGAIVSVLVVFAPSGLGVREASMYGLLLAVAPEAVVLGAVVLNRLAITLVEAGLLVGGAALFRGRGAEGQPPATASRSPAA